MSAQTYGKAVCVDFSTFKQDFNVGTVGLSNDLFYELWRMFKALNLITNKPKAIMVDLK